MLKLIECPRDAMQGINAFIPTTEKVSYINKLIKIGFDTVDCGSYVSPKAIPQMQDTEQVINALALENSSTKLLVIVANTRGAEAAAANEKISYLGYPFSLSETFQQRNTNRSINDAYNDLLKINELAQVNKKELVVYFSMGFGNPYGDEWNAGFVELWLEKLQKENIKIFSLADTVGGAKAEDIKNIFTHVIKKFPLLEIGAHFHSRQDKQAEKIQAALDGGCTRFDSAMLGFGGCPMANDELTGNIATEFLVSYAEMKHFSTGLYMDKFEEARLAATELFGKYH